MSLYAVTIAIHVIVAVVGIGLIGAIPMVARLGHQADAPASAKAGLLDVLFRCTRWSLAAMALTGGLLDFAVHGAFHTSGWFRASVALLVLLGFSHARARGALRRGLASDRAAESALRRVERWGWTMCATVALMALLMEVKPF